MDNGIQNSVASASDRQAQIAAINERAGRLKKIMEESIRTGSLPDFGRPYEELTGIERQLYDTALRSQALGRLIADSNESLTEEVSKVYESTKELTSTINGIEASSKEVKKSLFSGKVTKFFCNLLSKCKI